MGFTGHEEKGKSLEELAAEAEVTKTADTKADQPSASDAETAVAETDKQDTATPSPMVH